MTDWFWWVPAGGGRKNSSTRNVFNFKGTLETKGIRMQWDDLYIRPSFAAMNKHFERFQIHKNLLLLFIFNHNLLHQLQQSWRVKGAPVMGDALRGVKEIVFD